MRLGVASYGARLRAPLLTAYGEVRDRSLVVVELVASDGAVGYGEAAPLEAYDGVSVAAVLEGLEACARVVHDGSRSEALAACASVCAVPQALAAVDLALWDLEGRRAGAPVWELLGVADPAPVVVNATGGAGAAREAGFGCVKVKVGLDDDVARVAAARAAGGPDMELRVDANGAWTVGSAIAALRALAPFGIELCEEPCAGVEAVRAVWSAGTGVPIAIDETAGALGALEERCCDAVCLKIARCGGITGVLADAARARRAGYELYLASTFDGPLGIAAALHAAAALAPERACGLATLGLFEGAFDPLPPRAGTMAVPRGPGLGDGLMGWYAERSGAAG